MKIQSLGFGWGCLLVALLFAVGCSKDEGGTGAATNTGTESGQKDAGSSAPAEDIVSQGGQEQGGSPFMDDGAPADDTPPDPIIVNGVTIEEGEIEKRFMAAVKQQTRGRPIPPAQLAQARKQARPQIVQVVIEDLLLDQRAESEQIVVSEEDMVAETQKAIRFEQVRSGMSEDEFAEAMQSSRGVTIDEFISQRKVDEDFRRFIAHTRLLRKIYPEETTVTEEEIQARYDRDKERVFTRPELVKASHILLGFDAASNEEAKKQLRSQAEGVLAEVQKGEVSFADLAGAHSSCPSKAEGGDLGFFPRKGAMVEPFAEAAFGLEVGDTSGIVETQFGYHIIRVTEKKEGSVTSLEAAHDMLEEMLRAEKGQKMRAELVAELKSAASIEGA